MIRSRPDPVKVEAEKLQQTAYSAVVQLFLRTSYDAKWSNLDRDAMVNRCHGGLLALSCAGLLADFHVGWYDDSHEKVHAGVRLTGAKEWLYFVTTAWDGGAEAP